MCFKPHLPLLIDIEERLDALSIIHGPGEDARRKQLYDLIHELRDALTKSECALWDTYLITHDPDDTKLNDCIHQWFLFTNAINQRRGLSRHDQLWLR
jgi:hypothetical protein